MNIHVGYQTNIWGRRIPDFPEVVKQIADAGFEGIEIAQKTTDLGGVENDYELFCVLRDSQLKLLGLAGGSVEERIQFARNYFKGIYIYIRNHADLSEVVAAGDAFVPVIHPHTFREVRTMRDARQFFKISPGENTLKIIPDTAHLIMSGEQDYDFTTDIAERRIAAIHLKNWKPEYGRSAHNYARGFLELEAEGPVKDILDRALKASYSGWVVCEQDASQLKPQDCVLANASAIKQLGLPLRFKWERSYSFRELSERKPPKEAPKASTKPPLFDAKAHIHFYEELNDAGLASMDLYFPSVARALLKLTQCTSASIWACPRGKDFLSLMALYSTSDQTVLVKNPMIVDSLAKRTLKTQSVEYFDKSNAAVGVNNRSSDPFFSVEGEHSMLSIPVANPCNLNHILYIINLLFDKELEKQQYDTESLHQIARQCAIVTDNVLHDVCCTTAGKVDLLNPSPTSLDSLIRGTEGLIAKSIPCEALNIFLFDKEKQSLYCATPDNIEWNAGANPAYDVGECITGDVCETKTPYICLDVNREYKNKGDEKSKEKRLSSGRLQWLLAPILDEDQNVLGLVRCANKRTRQDLFVGDMFNDDDAAILESLLQAVAPRLKLLLRPEPLPSAPDLYKPLLDDSLAVIKSTADIIREIESSQRRELYPMVAADIDVEQYKIRLLSGALNETFSKTGDGSPLDDAIIVPALALCTLKTRIPYRVNGVPNQKPEKAPLILGNEALLRLAFYELAVHACENRSENIKSFSYTAVVHGDGGGFSFTAIGIGAASSGHTWVPVDSDGSLLFSSHVISFHEGTITRLLLQQKVLGFRICFPQDRIRKLKHGIPD